MEQIGEVLARTSSQRDTDSAQSSDDYEAWAIKAYNNCRGNLNEKDGIDCPICKNKGKVMTAPNTVRICECMARRVNAARIEKSGLNFDKKRFSDFKADDEWQESLKAKAVAYSKDPQGWFFVGGQSGMGKTHICTAICANLLTRYGVRYFLWRDEAVELKALVNDPEAYSAKINEAKRIDVLYIDDLFKAGDKKVTAADVNLAFEILNYRYQARKPTIISSELIIDDIEEIDEAIAGRIVEMCGSNLFSFVGNVNLNYRTRGKRQ